MKAILKNFAVAVLLGGLALLPSTEALAQSRPAAPRPAAPADGPREAVAGKVSIDLMVIYAHKDDNRVDPELREVMQQLRSLPFSGYQLLDTHSTQLSMGQESSVALPGGKKLKMQLIDRSETHARVRLRVLNGDAAIIDTTVSIMRNRTFIIAGTNFQNGKLVLPVSVAY